MVRYRSFLWPVLLIAGGVVLLLGNLGYIPWESLFRLLDLWPLVLIVIGLELIIRRSVPTAASRPLALAVVALAAAVAVIYVAAGPPPSLGGSHTTSASAPAAGVESGTLRLDLGAATVHVTSGELGADLYQASFDYPAGTERSISVSGGIVHISDRSQRGPSWRWADRRHSLDITLNSALPWTFEVAGGATNATLDLGGVTLKRLSLSGGADHTTVTLPRPSGTVEIAASGGAEHLTLHRPAGVEASVRLTGGANTLDADGQHRGGLGSDLNWSSPGYAGASDRYSINVSGGASSVTVDTAS